MCVVVVEVCVFFLGGGGSLGRARLGPAWVPCHCSSQAPRHAGTSLRKPAPTTGLPLAHPNPHTYTTPTACRPVQSIMKFHSVEEVVRRANDNEYGEHPDPWSRPDAEFRQQKLGMSSQLAAQRACTHVPPPPLRASPGLAAGVISKDVNFVNTVSRSLRAGTVWGEQRGAKPVAQPAPLCGRTSCTNP